jgi:hypothetical protein
VLPGSGQRQSLGPDGPAKSEVSGPLIFRSMPGIAGRPAPARSHRRSAGGDPLLVLDMTGLPGRGVRRLLQVLPAVPLDPAATAGVTAIPAPVSRATITTGNRERHMSGRSSTKYHTHSH